MIGLLHLKQVQTYIIERVTTRLSKEWQADVRVAQFHYRPLSHLVIDSIYLSDQQKDTLAYIEQLELQFNPLALEDLRLDIEQLTLKKPYVNVQHRSDSSLNCRFILDLFQKDNPKEFPLQYQALLKNTGSMSCEEVCKLAGFDITTKDFWLSGVKELNSEFEEWKKCLTLL
jgi:hypothetical protein